MLRLRTEGIVAAAAASDFVFNDPNPGFASRAAPILTINSQVDQSPDSHPFTVLVAGARYSAGLIAEGDALIEGFVSALEASHPITTSGFEQFHAMQTWMRWKGTITTASNLHNRFRDVMVQFNTDANLNPINAAGWTQGMSWMNATAGYFIGQEWPNFNSNVTSNFNYITNTWLPTISERFFKNGQWEYYSPNYWKTPLACWWLLNRYATNPTIQKIGQFLWEQTLIEMAHVTPWANGSMVAATARQTGHNYGAPIYFRSSEIISWLLFGGPHQPGLVTKEAGVVNPPEPAYGQREGPYAVPFATDPQMGVIDVAWRIQQAIEQQGDVTFDSRHRPNPFIEDSRPDNRPAPIRVWSNEDYAVSTHIDPENWDNIAQTNTNQWGQWIKFRVTWRADRSVEVAQFGISSDSQDRPFSQISTPLSTPYENCLQHKGTVLQVFRLDGAGDPQYIEAWISDDIAETLTSGNWWFARTPHVLIAAWWSRGFAQQSPKDCINTFSPEPDVLLPWLRSPDSGSQLRHATVIETAPVSAYPSLSAFRIAITSTTRGGQPDGVESHVDDTFPRVRYTALDGTVLDLTYQGTKTINGVGWGDGGKRLESPWVNQDYDGNDMLVTDPGTGQVTRYRWSDKSITQL